MIALVKVIRKNKKNRIEVIFCKDKNKQSYVRQAKEQAWQGLDYQASVFLFSTDYQTGLLICNCNSMHEELEIAIVSIPDGYTLKNGGFEVYLTLKPISLY